MMVLSDGDSPPGRERPLHLRGGQEEHWRAPVGQGEPSAVTLSSRHIHIHERRYKICKTDLLFKSSLTGKYVDRLVVARIDFRSTGAFGYPPNKA